MQGVSTLSFALVAGIALAGSASIAPSLLATPPQSKGLNVLVFSKTAGFRHDSIPAGHKMFADFARLRGWNVTSTEDRQYFKMGDPHPIMWYQMGRGRAFYTRLGHTKETYQEPQFIDMIGDAVLWSARRVN
jgi:hypothetical protein